MSSLTVTGICVLTGDADLFKNKSGDGGWLHFGIAAFRKDPKEGQQKADYFKAEYYMKNVATALDKLLTKGKLIYLNRADLRNDKFMGRDGKEKSSWKVYIYSFDFLDKPPIAGETKPEVKKESEAEEVIPF